MLLLVCGFQTSLQGTPIVLYPPTLCYRCVIPGVFFRVIIITKILTINQICFVRPPCCACLNSHRNCLLSHTLLMRRFRSSVVSRIQLWTTWHSDACVIADKDFSNQNETIANYLVPLMFWNFMQLLLWIPDFTADGLFCFAWYLHCFNSVVQVCTSLL